MNRKFLLITTVSFLLSFWLVGCGSEDGPKFDSEAFCVKMVACCDDVGDKYCELKGDDQAIQDQCVVQIDAANEAMALTESDVCDEWWSLQKDYLDCFVQEDTDCDDIMGENRFSGDFGPKDQVCRDECNAMGDFVEQHVIDGCGGLVGISEVDEKWLCDAAID